jgi:hypothetical protein
LVAVCFTSLMAVIERAGVSKLAVLTTPGG